jgi:hypothetical protein
MAEMSSDKMRYNMVWYAAKWRRKRHEKSENHLTYRDFMGTKII